MTDAQRQIIALLQQIRDRGGAPAFADITGDPSENSNLATALLAKQTAAQVQTLIDAAASVGSVLRVIYVKNVEVLTADAPADIATISLPANITRWRLAGGNTVGTAGGTILAETADGTLAGANFTAFDAAGGTGLTLTAGGAGPASAGAGSGWQMVAATNISTSTTIHIRQTANSANVGTISFYLLIQPLL